MYEGVAHFYDFFQAPVVNEDIVAFLKTVNPSAHRFLEIGAGTGALAFRLALDFEVAAFEPSESMRTLLLTRLSQQRELDSKLSIVPTLDLIPNHSCSIAFARNVIFLLNQQESQLLLSKVAHKLCPSGKFVFNFSKVYPQKPDKLLSQIGEREIGSIKYRHFSSAQQVSPTERQVLWRFTTEMTGKIFESREELYRIHQLSMDEVDSMLHKAGLIRIQDFASFKGEVGSSAAEHTVVIAKLIADEPDPKSDW